MKNLKKWINLFVLMIFVSFEILTPISYAVDETFIESESVVGKENIWEEFFQSFFNRFTLIYSTIVVVKI